MTQNDNSEPESVDIRITKSEDYKTMAANGVRGGFQPRGDFKMDFLLDQNPTPDVEKYDVDDGSLGDITDTEGRSEDILRQRQIGVMMNPNHAFSIASWTLAQLLDGAEEEDVQNILLEKYDPIELQQSNDDGI